MKTETIRRVALLTAALGMFAGEAAERKLYVSDYRDRMAGAWMGQSVGVAYGAPTEFKKSGQCLLADDLVPAWKPERVNNMFQQDDLYVEMSFLETLEKRGVDAGPREAGIDFANSRYRLWCANANARDNLRRGIAAPDSSHPKNHPTTDDIDYQIESDFSGILSPGMPARVLKFGQTFGRIMNYGDGVYAGDFMGGMYAAAYFERDRVKVVEAGLRCIPAESWYAEMVRDMLAWYRADPKDWQGAWKKAVAKYGVAKGPRLGRVSWYGIDVKINGAMVLLGYLWGEGDIFRTMDISTRGGFDSDCNPSSALGVLGVQIGLKSFGPEYVSKLDRKATWEFTSYTWDKLLAVSEKLTREIVVREGGRIEKDEKGEYFVIPERPAVPEKAVSSLKPGPGGEARLTDAERERILYEPCKGQGSPSLPRLPPSVRRGTFADQVTWETLAKFCKTNARELKGPVKGIVVEHPWLGQQDMNYCTKGVMDRATREGVVYLHVWAHPWSWMNNAQVKLTDRLVDVVSEHFGLGAQAKVVSYGISMGGHGALAYPQFSRKNVVAAVANCPPCDLEFHYTERPDLPRTIVAAYADEPDFAAALRRHSPLASVETFREIPYFIYQGDADRAVNKERHGDRFVAAAAKRAKGPLKVTYVIGKGCGHAQIGNPERQRLEDALFAPFGK